jgi:hypothetical protein
MDAAWADEARRLVLRYLTEVVERFDLCPWARPARLRGELWIDVVDPDGAAAAITRFLAAEDKVVGLIVVPGLDGPPARLRAIRDELLAGPLGRQVALADFHPAAELDGSHASRLVPFLRRAPDPMLQAVRHADLASLHRHPPPMSPADQAAVLAGKHVAPFVDPVAAVATTNLATFAAEQAAITAVLDEIHADRARSYRALSTSPRPRG